ncbi:MAG: hypothetical protein JNL32_03835, partial [Candidatus Kapabacteria bacterium]|nr:hypothetical protein [Candidatus Kapabacteria bacterium]
MPFLISTFRQFVHRLLTCSVLSLLFAVTASAQVNLLFPAPDQVFYPERIVRLEWMNATPERVDVLYSLNRGASWNTIATGVSETSYSWKLPLLDTERILFKIEIASLKQPQPISQPYTNKSGVLSASFNPRGSLIAATLANGTANVRSADNGVVQGSLNLSPAELRSSQVYSYSPDTLVIAAGRNVVMYNFFSFGNVKFGAAEHGSVIRSAAVHPAKPVIATATEDGIVRIWDAQQRKVLHTFTTVSGLPLNTLRFCNNGTRIIYAGDEGIAFVREWDNPAAQVYELRGHGNGSANMAIESAALSGDGSKAVTAGRDYSVRIWNVEDQSPESIMFAHRSDVTSVRFSPDDTRVLSGSLDSTVRQWSVATGLELHPALTMQGEVSSVDYSPTGDTLLAAERNTGTMLLWKNVRAAGASDTVSGIIRYPIGLRIGNVRATVGTTTNIPILLDRIVSVPYFERARFEATCMVVLPSHLVSVNDTSFRELSMGNRYDTVFVPLVFTASDTVGRIPVRALLSDVLTDDIRLISNSSSIRWGNGVRAFILQRVENGVFEIDSVCGSLITRSVLFNREGEFTLSP